MPLTTTRFLIPQASLPNYEASKNNVSNPALHMSKRKTGKQLHQTRLLDAWVAWESNLAVKFRNCQQTSDEQQYWFLHLCIVRTACLSQRYYFPIFIWHAPSGSIVYTFKQGCGWVSFVNEQNGHLESKYCFLFCICSHVRAWDLPMRQMCI